jgi:hypothetical protein
MLVGCVLALGAARRGAAADARDVEEGGAPGGSCRPVQRERSLAQGAGCGGWNGNAGVTATVTPLLFFFEKSVSNWCMNDQIFVFYAQEYKKLSTFFKNKRPPWQQAKKWRRSLPQRAARPAGASARTTWV